MQCTLTASLGLVLLAVSVSAQRPADLDIQNHIQTSLLLDPRIDAADVDIAVQDGSVTLTGRVRSLAAHDYAIREAEKIAGVKGVIDKMTVNAPWRPDIDIAQDVRHRMINHSRLSTNAIGVTSTDGEVVLTGQVPAYVEKQLATELASEVRGVRKVTNEMTVDYSWTRGDEDIQKDVADALQLDVYLNGLPVHATVHEGQVTLEGTVGSWYDRRRAENSVRWLPGVRGVTNKLEVAWYENDGERVVAPVFTDAELTAKVHSQLMHDTRIDASRIKVEVTAGDARLAGTVPTSYEKNIALEDAKNTVGVAWVGDDLMVRTADRADAAIRADVLWELDVDYLLWGADVSVQVKDGVVTLGGKLHTRYQRNHAIDVAYRIRGVRRVIDDIRIVDSKQSDVAIGRAVERRLHWDWRTFWASGKIQTAVSDGTVTLSGTVRSWAQREAAGRIAYDTPGVWRVLNHLHVAGFPYSWGAWDEWPTRVWSGSIW